MADWNTKCKTQWYIPTGHVQFSHNFIKELNANFGNLLTDVHGSVVEA